MRQGRIRSFIDATIHGDAVDWKPDYESFRAVESAPSTACRCFASRSPAGAGVLLHTAGERRAAPRRSRDIRAAKTAAQIASTLDSRTDAVPRRKEEQPHDQPSTDADEMTGKKPSAPEPRPEVQQMDVAGQGRGSSTTQPHGGDDAYEVAARGKPTGRRRITVERILELIHVLGGTRRIEYVRLASVWFCHRSSRGVRRRRSICRR